MTFLNLIKEEVILDTRGNRIFIDSLLSTKPGYTAPKSLDNLKKTMNYDHYFASLDQKYIEVLNKEKKYVITIAKFKQVNHDVIFALQNLTDLPSNMRDYIYDIVARYIDVLKESTSYPNEELVCKRVSNYLPLFKDVTIAARDFLLKNK